MDIPVYMFVGFLESGKTKFIQETLEDSRFNKGEKTLLLVCEEGEIEYDPSRFASKNVYKYVVENEEDLTPQLFEKLRKDFKFTRVVLEYNGMWMLQSLFDNMPQNWLIYQAFMFADSKTFSSYNTNMRGLVVDKLAFCELVVFNRTDDSTDKMGLHKIVRGVSRRIDIAFEKLDGTVDYDDIEDPLPFDINAPIIEIEDRDFAIWYRDMTEELDKYEGKKVKFKGKVEFAERMPENCFVIGRDVMTCCVDDITYAGLIFRWGATKYYKRGDWVTVTGKIELVQKNSRKGPIPIIIGENVESAEAPEQPVATFY